jgi:hypothetical protein
VAAQLFLFVQAELPGELGPPDGRYLLRRDPDGEPERVLVLETIGAPRRHGRLSARRRPPVEPQPAPETAPAVRVTAIDPVPVSAERQARAWLEQLDAAHETGALVATLNRVVQAHRIAAADLYAHPLSPSGSLIVRAGWGEGEQVAYGRWLHARELRRHEGHTRRRVATLRPQERFVALLGAREHALVCEELALRARLDLHAGRLAHAALELEQAYAAALAELSPERHPDLALRLAELQQLRSSVVEAARAALGAAAPAAPVAETPGTLDGEALEHALARLEATLRARAAGGVAAGS